MGLRLFFIVKPLYIKNYPNAVLMIHVLSQRNPYYPNLKDAVRLYQTVSFNMS